MTRLGVWLFAVSLTAACSSPPPPRPRPDNREAAYQENNRGVAELERYAYDKAVESFRRAIALDDRVTLPYVNLPIALYYASNLEDADRAAATADAKVSNSPQVAYVRGIIARALNRSADAEAAFKRVLALDPDDGAAMINLGQLYLQDRRTEEAIAVLRTAVARETANATARYALGQALIRSGARDEGARETARFESLRDSGAGVTYSQTYLEQGHYAEALVSTGMEADLVNRAAPAVRFTPWEPGPFGNSVTPEAPSPVAVSPQPEPEGDRQAILLADIDLDGDLDLLLGSARGVRLLKWENGKFADESPASGLPSTSLAVSGIAVADLDNDERPDLLLLHPRGISVRRQTEKGVFVPFSKQPSIPLRPDSAALLDADHDGDLDILITGREAASAAGGLVLLRNSGPGAFTDITKAAGLTVTGRMLAAVPIDFDNRRDVDIVALSETRPAGLFQNQRNGSFRDVAAGAGLASWRTAGAVAMATCDLNKDGFADFIAAGGTAAASLALSDGRGRFTIKGGPAGSQGLTAVQCADYDNDGLLDMIGSGAEGLRVFRNAGTDLDDVTTSAVGSSTPSPGALDAFAVGDIDADGDIDVAIVGTGGVRFLRNDGGSAHPSLRVALKGRVSNRSAIGARVDVRAGSLWQRLERLAVTPPVGPETPSIGLATHTRADAIRVLWPAGILQAETEVSPQAINLVELDRKPSSCPFLYTWNGQAFEFITDFLGGGELGYWEGPGQYNHPDPDEFVRVTGEQLKPRDGRLELRVTNELEEVAYLDQVRLLSVDHPADVEIYPREGMRAAARQGLSVVAVRNVTPIARAWSDRGDDMTAQVTTRDGHYSSGFVARPIRGYAETHDLVFETRASARGGQSQVLLLTGWTDYAFSSDNVAAVQLGWKLEPPALEVRSRGGAWRVLVADAGIPVGRPQTLVVDIGDAAQPGSQFRLRTNMRMHWDAIAVADIASDVDLTTHEHLITRADLRWRGYSTIDDSRTPSPAIPNYDRVLLTSPWKVFAGRYTREGDVRSLLAIPDDLFVVARTGDDVALQFEDFAGHGARRTYLVGGLGFSKEMDLNSASPDAVLPLPARGMTHYPSVPPSSAIRARQREMLERYNTRVVSRSVPSINSPVR